MRAKSGSIAQVERTYARGRETARVLLLVIAGSTAVQGCLPVALDRVVGSFVKPGGDKLLQEAARFTWTWP